MELGVSKWHLRFSDGRRHRDRVIEARDLAALWQEIEMAKQKLDLPAEALLVSCFEAGRDGHWLHRALWSHGVHNLEVASTSIKVNQQGKHRKTDRLDLGALLQQLSHYAHGECEALQVVHVPSPQDEDELRPERELRRLKDERTRHTNRMGSTLIRFGVRLERLGGSGWAKRVASLRDWAGELLPVHTQGELIRENERLDLVQRQIKELEGQRDRQIAEGEGRKLGQVRQLMLLRSLGPVTSSSLVMEFYGWRRFRNRREIGALAGLVGTPYQSGQSAREQGISKAGNPRVRALAIELAWMWVRLQPHSRWTLWFEERFAHGSKRMRKIGIVGVARHLLIDLWRYLEDGTLPAGAELKQA
jgi:transposase